MNTTGRGAADGLPRWVSENRRLARLIWSERERIAGLAPPDDLALFLFNTSALAGEVGEGQEACQKLLTGTFTGTTGADYMKELMGEAADIAIYAVLVYEGLGEGGDAALLEALQLTAGYRPLPSLADAREEWRAASALLNTAKKCFRDVITPSATKEAIVFLALILNYAKEVAYHAGLTLAEAAASKWEELRTRPNFKAAFLAYDAL